MIIIFSLIMKIILAIKIYNVEIYLKEIYEAIITTTFQNAF